MSKYLTSVVLALFISLNSFSQTGKFLSFDSLLEADAPTALLYSDSLTASCKSEECGKYLVEAGCLLGVSLDKKHLYDSAEKVYLRTRTYAQSIGLKTELANIYRLAGTAIYHKGAYDSAKNVLRKAMSWSRQYDQYHTLGRTYNTFGIVCRRKSQLDSSLIYYDLAMEAFEKSQVAEGKTEKDLCTDLANIYKNRGIVYATLNIEEKALDNFLKTIALEEKYGLEENLAKSYLNLAVFYKRSENYDRFREAIEKARVINEKLDKSIGLCLVNNNLGTYFAAVGQLDSAHHYFKKGLKYAKRASNKYYIGLVNQNIGNYFLDKEVYDSALIYTMRSANMRREIGYTLGVAQAERNLGLLYAKTGHPDAEEVLLRSLRVFEDKKSSGDVMEAYSALIEYYENEGEYNEANAYLHQMYALNDSLKNQQTFNKVSNLEVKYGVEKYQKELEQQDQLLAQNRKINYLLIAVIVLFAFLVAAMVYAFVKLKKVNRELVSKNHKIDTLMRELHHRVKNNLQVISSLLGLQGMSIQDENAKKVVQEGKNRVRAMSLIHQQLYSHDNATSINTKKYIEQIVKELTVAYGLDERIKIEMDLHDVKLDVDTTLPLGLIINELVSNAMKYAFKDIEEPMLKLSLLSNNGQGKLIVEDNGVGDSDLVKNNSSSFGLRLVNLLTEQMKGRLMISGTRGIRYELEFSLK